MRRCPGLLVLALLLVGRSSPVDAAAVEGRVTLPAEAAPMARPRYPVATTYTVGEPDPPTAIVYLEGDFGPAPTAAAPLADVAQRTYQFAPGLLAVRRGSVVRFPNLDEEYHSVFSYSKTRRFDLGRYQRDEGPPTLRFDQAGVVRLFCEIHEHMRGTILVLDTPHFTRTDPEGRYRLDGLPAGRFVLKAWIDDDTVRAQPVEIRDGATLHADFPE
jgi:plastocyanin